MKRAILLVLIAFTATAFGQTPEEMTKYFQDASQEFNVPLPVLEALGYIETHWEPIPNIPGRSPMGLRDDPSRFNDNLDAAAGLIGKPVDTLEQSPYQNIRGAAAYLSSLRDGLNKDSAVVTDSLSSWWRVIAQYSGIPQPAIAMQFAYHTLEYVASGVDTNGIVISPNYVDLSFFPDSIKATGFIRPGNPVPSPVWVGSPSYYPGRGGAPIVFVIIHDTEEQFDYAYSLFENRSDQASAQYIVRSQDGYTIQCVRDSDEAWAVRCWNPITLNIEHEGFVAVSDSSYYTEAEYESSARLTARLCQEYNIPEDSLHVFGHDAWTYPWFSLIPFSAYTQFVGMNWDCNTHTDPGKYWDWHHYFNLIHSYDTTEPAVVNAMPESGASGVPGYSKVVITFNCPMDPRTTDSSFSIIPHVTGRFSFNPNQTQLTFIPDTLLPWSTTFTVHMDSLARGSNTKGLSAPYSFHFTTTRADTSGPVALAFSPRNNGTSVSQSYFEFVMNAPINYSEFPSRVSLVDSTGKKMAIYKALYQVVPSVNNPYDSLTLIALGASLKLTPGMKYTATLAAGLEGPYGIPSKSAYTTTFTVDTSEATGGTILDGFESSYAQWLQPSACPNTSGVDTASTSFSVGYGKRYAGNGAGTLNYVFDAPGGICELENKSGFNVGGAYSVGMWVFGDNSRNELDFVFGSSPEKLVPVDTVDWYGWKYVGMWRDPSDGSTGILKGFAIRSLDSALFNEGTMYFDDLTEDGEVTGLKDPDPGLPIKFELDQNYPNPFNPTTTIGYVLPASGLVTLKVYDDLGREVRSLADGFQTAGRHFATFEASGLPSGVYFYRIICGEYLAVKKMTLMK